MITLRSLVAARKLLRAALGLAAVTVLSSLFAAPQELKTQGNQIVIKASGEPVRLTGVNIPSLEWLVNNQITYGDHLLQSLTEAKNSWKANVVRLPVRGSSWLADATYRSTVASFINTASSTGVYVILDLHGYNYPTTQDTAFWTSAATAFKNAPAVLFGLFNEPAGTTLAEWRNGINGGPGIQGLLDTVRATGANNVVLAGALGAAFKLRDIVELGYTLTDTAGGNGVVYDAHIYPWSGSAQYWVGTAMQAHPVLIGEIGHPNGTNFDNHPTFEDDASWVPKLLNWVDAHNANWTGWSMHPTANPVMISDWSYTPTAYWGAPAKASLLSYRDPNALRVLGGTVIGTTGTSGSPSSGVLTDYQRGAVAPFGDNLDNNVYYFDGPTLNNSWTGLDLHQAFRIFQIQYMPRANQGALMVGGVFQGANQANFSDAVTLFTVTQAPNAGRTLQQSVPAIYTGAYTTANVSNTGTYRYVRYVGPAGSRCNVAKILFLGKGLFGAATTGSIIMDSTDTSQVVRTGTWQPGNAVAGYIGDNYLHDNNELKGSKSVTYSPAIPAAAPYRVFMNWTANANRSDSVIVEVASADGAASFLVNQKLDGGVWNYIGTFNFAQGSAGYVRIRNDNPGYVIADGVMFEEAPPPIVIDNAASSGVTVTGAWNTGNTGSYLGSNYLHDDNTGKGTKSVRYTPAITAAGDYEIFARWAAASNRATNVPIDIVTPSGTVTVTVNQRQNNGQWYSLGTYSLAAGSSGSVLVRTTGTNGYVIADAVKFVALP